MSLDDKLASIIRTYEVDNHIFAEDAVAQLKQAFADAGYITPEQVAKTQELVNQMANLANDMARMPVLRLDTKTNQIADLMTGQEWYDRFENELRKTQPEGSIEYQVVENVRRCVKRAAGLTE